MTDEQLYRVVVTIEDYDSSKVEVGSIIREKDLKAVTSFLEGCGLPFSYLDIEPNTTLHNITWEDEPSRYDYVLKTSDEVVQLMDSHKYQRLIEKKTFTAQSKYEQEQTKI